MFKDQQILAEAIQKKGIIKPDLLRALNQQGLKENRSFEEIIIEDNIIDEEQLAQIKSEILRIPYVNLSEISVPNNFLNMIPKKVSENYKIISFAREGDKVKLAMMDPQDFKAIEAVEFLAKEEHFQVEYFIMSQRSFNKIFKQYEILSEEAEEALAGYGGDLEGVKAPTDEEKGLEATIKSAPVSKMVLVIIRHAIDGRASDIHIEPTATESRVRYRIDGVLHTSLVLPKYIHASIVSRIKVLSNLKLDETRKPQDGRIRLNIEGRNIDFRISTLPLYDGEKVVMRILATQDKIPTLSDLGFNDFHVKAIENGIKKPHGMMLITGPTGSGKTSTLYTILSMLNSEGINIITLEDPVEYYVSGINQSQINPEVGYSFASGLRSILRQDPNIIMLGEIRDQESTELVVHASLTGHMVLSTLHTNDSLGAVPRLIDMGAQQFLLASTMNMVLAQRLARRICEKCKYEVETPADIVNKVKEEIKGAPEIYQEELDLKKIVFYKGKGCAICGGSGYKGRVAMAEVIQFTDRLKELVATGYKLSDVMPELKKQSFITLRQDGIIKALKGYTALEEVFRVSQM
ncbi:MAG: Type IV pilus assembly protein PilB [Parcubacteria group bacterium GW2011_GWA2_38_13]|nr:MAG: Type IV pilus assembly protein PilB [Parcubacteria group bacterium GW2011_GWA2_38_13]